MKKILIVLISFFLTSAIHAQTCPPAEQLFHNGLVTIPPGWKLIAEHDTSSSREIGFMTASWGDHSTNLTPVSCYYFDKNKITSSYVYIKSTNAVPRPKTIAHYAEWQKVYPNDDFYYLCGGYDKYHNVNSCSF